MGADYRSRLICIDFTITLIERKYAIALCRKTNTHNDNDETTTNGYTLSAYVVCILAKKLSFLRGVI